MKIEITQWLQLVLERHAETMACRAEGVKWATVDQGALKSDWPEFRVELSGDGIPRYSSVTYTIHEVLTDYIKTGGDDEG